MAKTPLRSIISVGLFVLLTLSLDALVQLVQNKTDSWTLYFALILCFFLTLVGCCYVTWTQILVRDEEPKEDISIHIDNDDDDPEPHPEPNIILFDNVDDDDDDDDMHVTLEDGKNDV